MTTYQLGNAKVWDGSQWVEAEGGFVAGIPMTATGGTITTFTEGPATYKMHRFTTNGTFQVTELGTISNAIEYIVIAGGGAGGDGTSSIGGGGGAGGMVVGAFSVTEPTSIAITVGTGGVLSVVGARGPSGGASSIGALVTTVGGGGGGGLNTTQGANGGSGGGNYAGVTATPGQGTAGQGNAGSVGLGSGYGGGGGGKGSASIGSRGGGAGYFTDIENVYQIYARGGGVPFETITQNANRGDGGNGKGSGGFASSYNGADGVVILRYVIS